MQVWAYLAANHDCPNTILFYLEVSSFSQHTNQERNKVNNLNFGAEARMGLKWFYFVK